MRRNACITLVAFACSLAFASNSLTAGMKRPAWLPKLDWAVGMCETRLNWRHNNSSYEGAFGFSKLAWRQYRYRWMPAHAWQATPWQQYQVIRRIGLGGNGCYIHGGYRYWMARA